MAVLKYLDLSTTHVREGTFNPTACPMYLVADYDEGAIYYVPDEIDAECPTDLAIVLHYAAMQGCTLVRFDADADKIDQLPIYDW